MVNQTPLMDSASPPSASGGPPGLALLQALRPEQWVKNMVVLAALLFGQKLTDAGAVGRSLAAFAIFAAATTTLATTYSVPGDSGTIQGAIDLTNPAGGDTVLVAAGTYLERLVIDHQLVLQGAGSGSTVIDASGGTPGIYVHAGGTVADRLVIKDLVVIGSTADAVRIYKAGGLSFEVVKPFEEHRVTYDGNVCFLRDPLEMDNPSKAFKQNPQVPVQLELDWHGRSPGWGGEPRRRADDGSWEPARLGDASKQFARGHFEQHGAVEGSLSIDGRKYDLKGHGLRDHSWGPRFWQNTGYYRWLTITLGEDFGLMGVVSEVLGESDQKESSNGYVYRKGEPNKRIVKVDLETEFGGEQNVHRSIKAQLHAEDGELFDVQGKVLSLVPCRNRRDGWVTRISEGMTEWRCGEHVGHGMSEYLDHLVKGE